MASDTSVTREVGEKLKKAREDAGLTQDDVAKAAKISANYYAKIERGEINTTLKKLYKITKALNIKASDIFPD
jgi:transcriptional regulator with XRE-family HTH domain